jgi:hypothetical protein
MIDADTIDSDWHRYEVCLSQGLPGMGWHLLPMLQLLRRCIIHKHCVVVAAEGSDSLYSATGHKTDSSKIAGQLVAKRISWQVVALVTVM